MGPNHALLGQYRIKFTKLSKYIQIINAYGQPMRQRLMSLNVEKRVITNRTPLGSHAVTQFTRRSPKKTQRPRAVFLLRVHRGLGLEKQLDHLRAAVSGRPVQRGRTSVWTPEGAPDAPSHKMIETVHPEIYPSKFGTKLWASMFVFEGLFHACVI